MGVQYSVVATTFNDENKIIEYLNEICKQTLEPREIVIADGGSKDRTVDLIKEFADTSAVPIILVQKGRLNISQGYNEAIKAAKSAFIGITGVGNRYDRRYFEKLSEAFSDKSLDLSYSPIRGLDTTEFSQKYNSLFLYGERGQRLPIASNHGALVKKKVFEDLGYFYEKFIYAGEDGEFYSLVRDKGYKTTLVEDAFVYWDTPHNWKEFLKQIRVYTIGDLQIKAKDQWNSLKSRIYKVLFGIALFIAYVISLILVKSLIYRICLIAFAIVGAVVLRKKLNPMRLARLYLPIYYTIKYKKYMGVEYAVKR